MTGPTVVALQENIPRPVLQEQLAYWRDLLAKPELLEKAIFFNEADYVDLRIPEGKRWWLSTKDARQWKRQTESYRVAIPVGGLRTTGMECSLLEPMLSIVLDELSARPVDFPDLRHITSDFGMGEDVWWGEDISKLWAHRGPAAHRAIGRAFGYREERILERYPYTWLEKWRRVLAQLKQKCFGTIR